MSMTVILTSILHITSSFKADHVLDHGELLRNDAGTNIFLLYVHIALMHATFIDNI